MTEVTEQHVEKETLSVSVIIPEHDKRGAASALFTHSRKDVIDAGGVCFICGKPHSSDNPLEAHHHPVERCFAEEIDWQRFAEDAKAGLWGKGAAAFDWDAFFVGAVLDTVEYTVYADEHDTVGEKKTAQVLRPKDIYLFVDDMHANGMLLCKEHHTVADEGIHTLPFPIWLAQRYAVEGTKFSDREVIHHTT